MPFPWPSTPPEISHQLLSSGDQATSFLGTAAALAELAALMGVDATTMSANAAATAPSFMGLAGIKSVLSASTYTPLAATGAGWLGAGSGLVEGLAGAYTTAKNTMIPAPVALATRESAEAWAAANWHGFFTPIVTSLYELYGDQWVTNASSGSGWETAVFGAAGPLGVPAPMAPVMANPAGMAAQAGQVAETAAERPASAAMRRSFAGVQEALTTSAGAPGGMGMESLGSMMSLASTPMSMAGSSSADVRRASADVRAVSANGYRVARPAAVGIGAVGGQSGERDGIGDRSRPPGRCYPVAVGRWRSRRRRGDRWPRFGSHRAVVDI